MNIIITLLILGIIILIHELGHFLSAKYFKMPVSEFAIGMGPKLFSIQKEYTLYSIRAIPMGGFVNIDGMDIENPVENGFNNKKPLERFIVLFAGVFMNFILALVIVFSLNFLSGGQYHVREDAIIGSIIENSPASTYLQKEDVILEINNKPINKWTDINILTSTLDNPKVNMLINRNGEMIPLEFNLEYNEQRQTYLIGIQPHFDFVPYTFTEKISASLSDYKNLFTGVFKGLKMLFSGEVKSTDMAGPVGLVKIVGTFTSSGIGMILMLVALLSVNIGILNLMPFPALDGGRIIFVILELFGIKVNKKIEEKIHYLGMFILLILIVLITLNDIKNLFR